MVELFFLKQRMVELEVVIVEENMTHSPFTISLHQPYVNPLYCSSKHRRSVATIRLSPSLASSSDDVSIYSW
jgi:hypothetical protein